jgi:Flp pilus assembly protein TadG
MRKSKSENRNSKFVTGVTSSEFRFSRFVFRAARNQGSALTEYAIVLIVLLTFLFGIMDFSRFLYTYHFVSDIAREGTRYAVVRGATFGTTSCASTSTFACNATAVNVQSYVQGLTPPGITPSSLTVTTTWPGTAPAGAATSCNTANGNNSPGCLVQVAVSYPYKFMLPFLPKSSSTWTVSSTSVMVISQ